MLKLIKPILGTLLFASASCFSTSSGIAATFSEIPLDAVTIEADELSASEDLKFQVGVVDLAQLDPNWRLTSFTAELTDRDGNAFSSNFRAWSGVPAPGWRAVAVAETENNSGGYRFEALDYQNGIAPGESLNNFVARSNVISPSGEQLRISSVSSTNAVAVPEPTITSGIIAFGVFLSFGAVLKRRQVSQRNEN